MPLAAWIYRSVREDAAAATTTFVAAALPGVGVMLLVGLLACTAPLLRALRIEPTEAMRSE
jgi:ABC-type lipoprotein release transport system permease subunit